MPANTSTVYASEWIVLRLAQQSYVTPRSCRTEARGTGGPPASPPQAWPPFPCHRHGRNPLPTHIATRLRLPRDSLIARAGIQRKENNHVGASHCLGLTSPADDHGLPKYHLKDQAQPRTNPQSESKAQRSSHHRRNRNNKRNVPARS